MGRALEPDVAQPDLQQSPAALDARPAAEAVDGVVRPACEVVLRLHLQACGVRVRPGTCERAGLDS